MDVDNEFRRSRISEQLRIEKEVFPECIQARAKYTNKRKSLQHLCNKENKVSLLPGEEVSHVIDKKMDQSVDNVQRWLKKYARQPLGALNPNDNNLRGHFKSIDSKKKGVCNVENKAVRKSTRKRSHFETSSIAKKQLRLDNNLLPVNVDFRENKPHKVNVTPDTSTFIDKAINLKTHKEESSIDVDEDVLIVIDDSETERVDKDMNAWLAVLEAENNVQNLSQSSMGIKSKENVLCDIVRLSNETRVKFFKRCNLSDSCKDCNEKEEDDIPKDVAITIDNRSFTAIINVTRMSKEQLKKTKQSVEVQTDILGHGDCKKSSDTDYEVAKKDESKDIQSNDLIKNEKALDIFYDKFLHFKSEDKSQNIIIEESDSDEGLEASLSLKVVADIHRSCDDNSYDVLGVVDNLEQHMKRPRRAARGYTPTSTDSSDKENFNPNRDRKEANSKKKSSKK